MFRYHNYLLSTKFEGKDNIFVYSISLKDVNINAIKNSNYET